MTTGTSALGLGVLFYVISGLLMPFFELARTIKGKSSLERWMTVVRNALLSAGVVAVVGLAMIAIRVATGPRFFGGVPTYLSRPIPFVVLVAVAILAVVTGTLRPDRAQRPALSLRVRVAALARSLGSLLPPS